jgi:trans-aconitate methyltransferase
MTPMAPGGSDSISEQTWTARGYAENAAFVPALGADVLAWLDPSPGERILDLGCGDGALTAKLVDAGAAVLGVDTSEDMLAAARQKGLDVRTMDGQALTFAREFDAVFSNAALHWMTRPRDVIAGVARALKPGGRFVAEFGGHGNVAAIVTALRAVAKARGLDPLLAGGWFYPTPDEYRALLEERGFTVERIGLFPRPTPLPTGMSGWLLTFRKPFFDAMSPEDRARTLAELEDLLAPALRDQGGRWTADYVRLRVRAVLPA